MLTFYELDTSGFQIPDISDDVVRAKCDMLDASSSIKVDIFFYLRLPFSVCGLVDRHFHHIVWRRHHDGLQGRELAIE